MELQTTKIHGHRIGYYLAGRGPALLLLHGIGSSSLTWKRVIETLARRYTVIAPDLLGHGTSERLRGDYSLGAHASGVRDLMVKLGYDRATVCGHSLGGGVAMVFAYQFPERCERLVLVSSGGLGQEVSPLLRLLSLPGSDLVVPLGTFSGLTRTVSRVGGALGRLGLQLSPRVDELWQCYTSLGSQDARKAFLSTLREVVDFQGQRVSAVDRLYLASQVPVMIVWGSRDEIIPVDHAHSAHREMPGSRLEIFEGVAHFPHAEQPERFVELLDDFFAQNKPARVTAATWRRLLSDRADEPAAGNGAAAAARQLTAPRTRRPTTTPRRRTRVASA
ncbi:MAG TPA: alpha/beta fold hydrolase [Candidatus Dormibacteraeota bacterium]|nr:alpha/beta fold hydrolase [Candidatus Dormibacteraeota bacterium]